MNKKLLWIIICVVALIIVLVLMSKGGGDSGIRVSAEKIARRDITEIVTASGKVYPVKEVRVMPDISGEVVELNVTQEGDSVKKGQVLAKVYADIYSDQRDQAAALVRQQEALVSNMQAQLPGMKATLDAAKKTYDRQKQLLDQKVISQSEFDAAESSYKTALSTYTAAQQTVTGNQASVASARASLNIAAKNVSRTNVISPMDGVVSLLDIKKGERVVGIAQAMTAATELMRVADMSNIEAIVDVGENDIPKVRLGDTALIEVDAYNNRKFKGLVTEIASNAPAAAGATTTNDVTNYKVHIHLLPDSYKDLIDPKRPRSFPFRPGMSASADIQTSTHSHVLAAPINAVTTREQNSDNAVQGNSNTDQTGLADKSNTRSPSSTDPDVVVFLLKPDNTVRKVKVRTDIQDLNYIEILDSVKVGDQIITGPYSVVSKVLKSGMKVKVVPKDQLFDQKKD